VNINGFLSTNPGEVKIMLTQDSDKLSLTQKEKCAIFGNGNLWQEVLMRDLWRIDQVFYNDRGK
jgi:hypothetical protein